MFRDEKNLKDSSSDLLPNTDMAIKDGSSPISYNKGNKLITALYMVTDIMDKGEPLRNKLRTLGTDIISDIHSLSAGQASVHQQVCTTISEIMSFLDIARTLNLISDMNCDILEKEFHALDRFIKESTKEIAVFRAPVDLTEFFRKELEVPKSAGYSPLPARLGIQRGSTLLGSLEKMSKRMPARQIAGVLKEQRRKDILNIIKINGGNATIKDIKNKAAANGHITVDSLSEKTLQRELVAMVKDNVLDKSGSKRWSKYLIK